MANSYTVQEMGDTITITADATLTAREPVLIGAGLFGIPLTDVVSGDRVALKIGGVENLVKAGGTGVVFSVGEQVYWDESGKTCTEDPSDSPIGICTETAADAATSVNVLLNRAPAEPGLIYQEVTVASGGASSSTAVTGGQGNGKPVIATIQAAGANAVFVKEVSIAAGKIEMVLSGDPGAGDATIGTWTDNR